MDILEKIKSDIKQEYYTKNYPNDGQRFVAWYMRNIHLLDQKQAKDAVTDGAKDKQIDAIYVDDENSKVFVVQGKYYSGEHIGAEPVREMLSVHSQLQDIAHMQENANPHLRDKLGELAKAIEDDDYSICYELITTSTLTDDAQSDAESFQNILSKEEDNIPFSADFEIVDKDGLAAAYERSLERDNPSITNTIQLEHGKYLITEINSTKIVIAAVSLKECIKIQGIKDGTLFQKNVRQSLGPSNTINKKIRKTIIGEKSSDFFFFHNGITAICQTIEELGNDAIKFRGMSVVNGCQSLSTIMGCSESIKKKDDAYVLFRFYEIQQKDRAEAISINTNSQSQVKARDLRSNDKRVLQLKKAFEAIYPQGFFATKRGDTIPVDKNEEYCVDLSRFGKLLMAWYCQRPNLSYGETKIFDKYFSKLFKPDYLPQDVFALNYFFNRIMEKWTVENPLSIDETILTMKAYAPYHLLFAISSVVAKCNNKSDVPLPSEIYKIAQDHKLVEPLIAIAANCMNNAFTTAKDSAIASQRDFIPQNWIKSKASIDAIRGAVTNYVSFISMMGEEQKKMKEYLKLGAEHFQYVLSAD
jgi:hypothetical protein